MDAILLAGGSAEPADPLFSLSGGLPKALLPIAGKPMAQWVLDALAASSSIERVIVVGLGPDCGLVFGSSTIFVPDAGSLLDNARVGLEASISGGSNSGVAMVVASDIPALNSDMVDWIAHRAAETDADLYYCAISREVMEARYPGSGRSYIAFKDGKVCGGDALVVRPSALMGRQGILRRLTESRKSAFRMAAEIGPDILLRFAFRRLTIADAARRIGARLGIRGAVLDCRYAEVGMDVDKPFQHALVEADLLSRGRS